MTPLADVDDADLVAQSVAGSREAFGQIVARYQGPVCAIAYSATGSLALSEDVAQETFLIAWRQLGDLREVTRLRSWLCGIARIQAANIRRREKREPARTGGSIDDAIDLASRDPLPPDQAISREEQAILWSTLERIPASYREPLVLFYREHQSVESVAQALDLSEDVVRQRLTRGRKLLHERMLAVVEGALGRTAPGEAFTLGVVATLPASTAGAALASVGAVASKGGAVAKSVAVGALFVGLLGPLLGAGGTWLGVRSNLEAVRTPRERAMVRRQTRTIVAGAVLFSLGVAGLVVPKAFWAAHLDGFVASTVGLVLGYAAWLAVVLARATSEQRRVREEERRLHPEAFVNDGRASIDWKSATTFLGLPLCHVRFDVAP
ncbi:MAG TPA: sigma-70 family RNA polymerase sigma factor, partial [Polyangiaceae bacterium]